MKRPPVYAAIVGVAVIASSFVVEVSADVGRAEFDAPKPSPASSSSPARSTSSSTSTSRPAASAAPRPASISAPYIPSPATSKPVAVPTPRLTPHPATPAPKPSAAPVASKPPSTPPPSPTVPPAAVVHSSADPTSVVHSSAAPHEPIRVAPASTPVKNPVAKTEAQKTSPSAPPSPAQAAPTQGFPFSEASDTDYNSPGQVRLREFTSQSNLKKPKQAPVAPQAPAVPAQTATPTPTPAASLTPEGPSVSAMPDGVHDTVMGTSRYEKPAVVPCGFNDLSMPRFGVFEIRTVMHREVKGGHGNVVREWSTIEPEHFIECKE